LTKNSCYTSVLVQKIKVYIMFENRKLDGFACIQKNDEIKMYEGDIHILPSLNAVRALQEKTQRTIVFICPYNVIREKGERYIAKGDAPIRAIDVQHISSFSRQEMIHQLEILDIQIQGGIEASMCDADFASMVKQVQEKEIARGEIAQVVLSRSFHGKIKEFCPKVLASIFRKILLQKGHYMGFVFSDFSAENIKEHTHFVGASPEVHLKIKDKKAYMNPIAGTYKVTSCEYKPFLEFLNDTKEIHELYQVLDEELKMISKFCPTGGKIKDLALRSSGAVIHTEFPLEGSYDAEIHALDALRETLHAPTLTGGPQVAALKVIHKYEENARNEYGGEIVILENDTTMDSAIMIRTAKIDGDGHFSVQSGAGIVQDSDPKSETLETFYKAKGMMNLLVNTTSSKILDVIDKTPEYLLKNIIKERMNHLSPFYLQDQIHLKKIDQLIGKKIVIIDNEDDFSCLLSHMVKHMGAKVEIISIYDYKEEEADIIILGPGPGDINNMQDIKMRKLQKLTYSLMQNKKPLLGVCLGHQAIAKNLDNIKISQQETPTQGIQRSLSIYNTKEKVAFYNSFSPEIIHNNIVELIQNNDLIVENNRVLQMRGDSFISCQYHPESVMTINGYNILARHLISLVL
jgi:2-amino-4-deoxychorismate synthase